MFKHIYEKHYNELITNTTKEALDDMITNKSPFFVANTQNNTIYGCLACCKSFSTESRAQNHFGGDSTCTNIHIAKMTKLSKEPKQVISVDEENIAWFKTVCHFLSCFDREMVGILETFNSYTTSIETVVKLLEDTQDKIIKNKSTEWHPIFSKIVKSVDKVTRECGGDVLGFMKYTTRCKWLPHIKQLNTIMTDVDVEFAKNYKIKSRTIIQDLLIPESIAIE